VEWSDHKLRRLYTGGERANAFPPAVVKAFIQRIQSILAAKDERDLRALKSLHYEKLKGRDGYSMRLNGQWRLEFGRSKTAEGIALRIAAITKHYER
jgi:proteic killer suppression protein